MKAGARRVRRGARPPQGKTVLSSFTIKNFKSYREATLKLAPLTVLIGANASGKSNAIEALRLLSWIAEGKRLGAIRHDPLAGIPCSIVIGAWTAACRTQLSAVVSMKRGSRYVSAPSHSRCTKTSAGRMSMPSSVRRARDSRHATTRRPTSG